MSTKRTTNAFDKAILKVCNQPRSLCWFDKLSPQHQADVEQVVDAMVDGAYSAPKLVIARAISEVLRSECKVKVSEGVVCKWLKNRLSQKP